MPVYKAHDTIKSTLHSVAMQRYVDFKCYLVVDGEEKGSYDYLKDILDVEIYYLPKNSGPAVARQYGIDHSSEPFISFIDADDSYLSSVALFFQHLVYEEDDKAMVISSRFLQEQKNKVLKAHQNDMVWMHGKMYRRAFLDKYDIRFNKTRVNEDAGFNTQCQGYVSEEEKIVAIQEPTYIWQWRDDSTVRTDNANFSFSKSIRGFVTNKIYAINKVLKHKELDDRVRILIASGLGFLYNKYNEAKTEMPKQLKFIRTQSKRYYDNLYVLIGDDFNEEEIAIYIEIENYKKFTKWKQDLIR